MSGFRELHSLIGVSVMRRDRTFYATLEIPELERRLRDVKDRASRADTMEAALADAFDTQEIEAALQAAKGSF